MSCGLRGRDRGQYRGCADCDTRWTPLAASQRIREADESSIETAIREVHEEVGLHTVHEGFLKAIDYWYWDTYRKDIPELVHKSVDFYLLRVVGGALSDASYEVDAVGWFTLRARPSHPHLCRRT